MFFLVLVRFDEAFFLPAGQSTDTFLEVVQLPFVCGVRIFPFEFFFHGPATAIAVAGHRIPSTDAYAGCHYHLRYLFGVRWQFLFDPPDVFLGDGIELTQSQFLILLLAFQRLHGVVVEAMILHLGIFRYQSNFCVRFL